MPTPGRNIRIPDGLWTAALAAAEREGTNVSAIVTDALRKFVKRHGTEEEKRREQIRTLVANLGPMTDKELLALLRG